MPLQAGAEKTFITNLYTRFLGRLPAPADVEGWTAVLKAQGALAVVRGIALSQERRQGHIQNHFYHGVLRREGAPAQVEAWGRVPLSLDEIETRFLASDEYLSSLKPTGPDDPVDPEPDLPDF